ncbi:MAG: gliding motility-associated C-terminal domain-containing protein [Bacteroidales bacterium]|nr:gliding motility-associated C-terminal domain-containing protein [Bacteroidales bacterium]MCF8333243.1 gliding motility-associated C-terminal domain-containing protein [Bacteroidales bacterium]
MKKISLFLVFGFILINGVKAQNLNLQISGVDDNPANADGLVTLSWTATEAEWEHTLIMKKAPEANTFSISDTVPYPETSYVDTVDFCQQDGTYQIVQINLDSTEIQSDRKSISEIDPTPAPLVLDSISISSNNNILLGWQKSNDYTLKGYKIFRKQEQFDNIRTISEPTKDSGIIKNLYPCDTNYQLLVIAYDNCYSDAGGSTNINEDYLQSPVRINNVDYNKCQQNVSLNFEGYKTSEGIGQEVVEYQLWRNKDGDDPEKITSADDTQNFSDDDLEPNREYEYFIRTVLTSDYLEEEATSSSCAVQLQTSQIPQPDTAYIASASVEGRSVQLRGLVDSAGFAQGYKLLRHAEDEEYFERILDTISAQTSAWQLTDETALPSNKSYFYKLVAIDSCGNDSKESNVARTIHLEITSPDNNTNKLSWNHYQGWDINDYEVYRRGSGVPEEKIADTIENSYTDKKFSSLPSGQWHYRVKATKTGNTGQQSDSAWSNEVIGDQEAKLQMPNAFKPSSNTHYAFKPVSNFIKQENYSLKIFNRWGALIFESNTPAKGWEGYYNGEKAPAGTYVYVLQYKNQNNDIIQKKGTVTLIR